MHNKNILITGATKGIGKALAFKLAEQGYNLALNFSSDTKSAEETTEELRQYTKNFILIKGDVSKSDEAKRIVKSVIDKYGELDVLVNNAGMNIDKPFLSLSEQEWDRVVNVNMKGTFLMSQQAAAQMLKQQQGGIIINLSATTAIGGRSNGINYCASKAGIMVMTKCMAKELGPKIRVNTVIPGFTRTPETIDRFNLEENEGEELKKRKIPLNRLAEPDEIAEGICFLISDSAKYINGQRFIIDGGEFMF